MASRTLTSRRDYSAAGNSAFAHLCRVHGLDRLPSAKLLAKNLHKKKNPDNLQERALCLVDRSARPRVLNKRDFSFVMRWHARCSHL
jgi:hypothetical protein